MKLTLRIIFILITFLIYNPIFGQDTISIYFEFGQSKIPDEQLIPLNAIPTLYDLSDLDSVYFIGMADSVGDLESNFDLSEKRARNVAKYCERIINTTLPVRVKALGESLNDEKWKNRRVLVIFFFKPVQPEEDEIQNENKIKESCYYIDYHLLHHSHIRTITKRKKNLVLIETTLPDLKKKKEQYYGSTTKNGEFIVKKVKWAFLRTGKLWWSQTRYVATIPEEDFKKYKIFKVGDLPCDSCSEDFRNKAFIINEDTCMQVDYFVMENMQIKRSLFNRTSVEIRVPREYINYEDKYYIGCGYENELIWTTKKGKRKQNYFYSHLPLYFNYLGNITRVMKCCKSNPEPSECDKKLIYNSIFCSAKGGLTLNAELGTYYQQSKITPYIAIGLFKEGSFSRVSLFVGTDNKLSIYSSLRYQIHIISFPYNILNPFSTWQSPKQQQVIYRYGRLYLGTELKSRFILNNPYHLEQNIHIGFAAVNTNYNAIIPRIFLEYGIGYDYLGVYSKRVYSIVQLGLNIKIARFKK